MFNVVRGIDGIHARICNGRHVRHGANDVWFDCRINVQPQFSPLFTLKARSCLCLAGGTTAHMQEGFLSFICEFHRCYVSPD